ncbi:MAG TPA: hypothetical protein VJ546_09545 [Bacillales bacterium]|nr:hypothetical protein [Bacillales bacterium]
MIIISVIFILAMSLSGMAVSTRMQFNKSDNRNTATDLAEMGITYYQSVVNKLVTSSNTVANQKVTDYLKTYPSATEAQITQKFNESFENDLRTRLSVQPILKNTVENENKFEINYANLALVSGLFTVTFTSKGFAEKETVIITGTITIQKSTSQSTRVGQTKPLPSSYLTTENNVIELQGKNKIANYNTSTYFMQPIHIQGNRSLIIKGDAFFSQELTFQGSANITINGDAIFQKAIIFPNGNPYSFCVYGNTYLVDANDKLINYPITQNKCSKPPSRDWSIDMDGGTTVQY